MYNEELHMLGHRWLGFSGLTLNGRQRKFLATECVSILNSLSVNMALIII